MNLLTKRIPTILGIVVLLAGIVGGYFYLQSRTPQIASEVVPQKVLITNVADNKFSVSWTTTTSTPGMIEYGEVGESLSTIARDDRDSGGSSSYTTHHVTVEGLQPSTQYAFRILSGENETKFDNNGSPYTTTTGPVIGSTPPSVNFYGNVKLPSGQLASGAIVYLSLPGSSMVSTVVNESGNYAITLSTIRTVDLRDYVDYDPSASVVGVRVESGQLQSQVSVSLANSAPVPTITLGQNQDFMNPALTPAIAEVQSEELSESEELIPTTPTVFNVEPLEAEVNVVGTTSVVLLNPKEEGETLMTLRPEFRGTGPAGKTLSIALTGQKSISDTTIIENDGTWTWAPVIDLGIGAQKITISYIGTSGTAQKLERGFRVSTSTTGLDPAFVSSPSGSITPQASVAPSKAATASSTPREAMPTTESGVPVTGVITNTLLTGALGIVILVLGAVLLAL